MSAQALANHGNGMIFWSDCRADCGTLEYQGTDYYWNLLDENARAAWGAQGMWAALPDINDGLQWMFSKLVLNRLEQENVAKKIVYLSSMGEKVDDTVIWGLDPNTNYGIWDRILCGEPDHRGNSPEMSRSLIRFKALNTIPEILGKDILGVRLRLFNWFGFQYTTPEVGREGPQRVLVSRLPDNDPNNLEWIEGTGGQTGITWNNSAAYFNYQTERRLPFENNLGCFTNPVLNETLFECRVQYIYRECLVSPSLIETWRDYPNKNEGFYLEPFFETGSDEYECAFTASEGTSNRYAPHLELYYLPQGQGNDHKPFRYIAVYNYDFIESSVFLDNDGSNYALLAIINNSGLPQCVLIYSPDAPTSGEVTEYNPNGTYIRVFDLQPAYQYHVNGGLQHVCDQGVKDWENTYDDWALIEPNVDLEGYEIRILKIPWR
jgi:hypothetical protein